MRKYFSPLWRFHLCKLSMPVGFDLHIARIANEHLDSNTKICKTMDAVRASLASAYGVRQPRSSGVKRDSLLRSTSTSWRIVTAPTIGHFGLCCAMGCPILGLDIILIITKRFC